MKSFSNKYIYIYSIVLVVVVAAVLALVAVGLKPHQQKNIKAENMQMLLCSAGINVDRDKAEDNYNKYITEEYTVNKDGQIIDEYRDGKQIKGERPFNLNIKAAYKAVKEGKNDAKLPVFVCTKYNGEKIYIIPVRGAGLWGDIWGNIALKDDLAKVEGVVFDHESETPGLGAKIKDDKSFAKSFVGKTIYEEGNFTSVKVIKRVDKDNPHAVDALSGATLTSNGVSDMINDCLKFYLPFFQTLKNNFGYEHNRK